MPIDFKKYKYKQHKSNFKTYIDVYIRRAYACASVIKSRISLGKVDFRDLKLIIRVRG